MKKFLKRALLPLALLGIVAGGVAGSASASGELGLCYNPNTGNTIYPHSTTGVYCYANSFVPYQVIPNAITIRGTHSYTNVLFAVIWLDGNGNVIGTSQIHQATGTSWGPGFNPYPGAVYLEYVVSNYAASNDSYYFHS